MDMVMIGDQLITDIQGANDFGIDSALTTFGVTDVPALPKRFHAAADLSDFIVCKSVTEVLCLSPLMTEGGTRDLIHPLRNGCSLK